MAENLGADTDAAQEVIEQLKEWGSHLTKNALSKWTMSVMVPTPCDSPEVSSGHPRPCASYAVVKCDVCTRPCCLAHARVDYMGDAICEVCIGEAKAECALPSRQLLAATRGAASSRASRPRARPHASWRHEPRTGAPCAQAEVERQLGSDQAQYRKLAYEHNADRPQTEAERTKNTARLKKLNEAFAVLKAAHEKREAA